MTGEIKIRPMESQDIEAVGHLENQCFSDPWSEKLLMDGLNSKWDTFWVAVLDDAVIGYSNLRVLSGEGELERIAVAPRPETAWNRQKTDGSHGRLCYAKPGQSSDLGGQKPEHSRVKSV